MAGNNVNGFYGDGRTATTAELNSPAAVMVDAARTLYIADTGNQRIREVISDKISTVAGIGAAAYTGDGAKATGASLNTPYGLALDAGGGFYIADLANSVVRKVDTSGIINTVAGNNTSGPGFSGDGGAATSAQLSRPFGLAIDRSGNLYIADSGNNVIRIVTTEGNINTYAGNRGATFKGDGGQATSASLNGPFGIAIDSVGNLYIADSANNRIRKVAPNGIITTVAGNGSAGYSGDEGPATKAQLNRPFDVAVDANGNLFIADYNTSVIREVTSDGVIHTIAGTAGYTGFSGDGGAATGARLSFPTGVAVDADGNVYIADRGNDVIRMLAPAAPSVSAGGVITAAAFGGATAVAPGSWIEIYGTNLAFNRRSWTADDFKGAAAPTLLDGTSVTIGGQSAFVDYISGGQVNVQVPSGVASGSQPLIVKSPAGSSAAYTVTVNATQPGLLAPASFKIGGAQFVVALFPDAATYVLPPGAITGLSSRRAKAGDTITLYGIGFGPVSPTIPAGQVTGQSNNLTSNLTISIGGTSALVTYAGLVSGSVGLYQFNVVVPNVAASDAVPVTVTVNGASGTQTLYTAVQ